MAAYVIAEFEGAIPSYGRIARVDKTRKGKWGERMIVDSSGSEALAGDWRPQRVVILEFPTMELAKAWWAARLESAPEQVRQVKRKVILVDGL